MAITGRALAFASRWFDGATVRRTFEPLIADWQREWQEASPSRRPSVTVRGLAAFVLACLVSSPAVLRSRAPKTVTDRVAVRVTRFIALASLVLMLPFILRIGEETGARAAMLLIALVPSSIAFAFPFSMVGAADAIRRSQQLAPHIERALALKVAMLSLLFMILFAGFVVPAANQAFRVIQTEGGAPVIRGIRELTTWELVNDPSMVAPQEPYTGAADRAVRIQRELNNRATLALVPALLLWVRWLAIARGRGTWWSPLPAPLVALIVFSVYSTTSYWGYLVEQQLHWMAGSGYWLPIAVFAVWGLLTQYWRSEAAEAR